MDNQFCKRCGQANFPDAKVCTKCGQGLLGTGGGSFPQSAAATASKAPKRNNKIYWIAGGIAAFLLLTVGVIILAAVGMFLYTSGSPEVSRDDAPPVERRSDDVSETDKKTDSDEKEDPPESENPMGDVTFPSGKDVDFGEEARSELNDQTLLSFFLDKKSKVGAFTLVEAKTSSDKTIFPNRAAGLQAEYKNGTKRLVHRVAVYKSLSDAKGDIETYKSGLANSGARIRDKKQDQVIFDRAGLVYLAFYNPQGALHEISSKNGNDILKYYNSYFKQ
ncbi:MAG: hypothetical protein KDB79_06460 [Acidobacteria bacterium]|nr:hypothetical protein [Acidobacteriota bacterium]